MYLRRPVSLLILSLVLALLQACVTEEVSDHPRPKKTKADAVEAYIQLGIGYLQEGNPELAKEPLGKALELDSSNPDAHAALAAVFQSEDEPQLAEEHYKAALSSAGAKDLARIQNNYGTFLYGQKRYSEAYKAFSSASQDPLYTERGRVFENLGLTAQALHQPKLARQHFQRALRLDPRQPRALLEMAQLSYDARDYVPAQRYYQGFRQLVGQSVDPASLLLGIRLANVFKDPKTASDYAEQLERLYPNSPEAREYRTGHR